MATDVTFIHDTTWKGVDYSAGDPLTVNDADLRVLVASALVNWGAFPGRTPKGAAASGGGGEGSPATWGTLSGKPSTFPPASHQHAVGDVPGLQNVLDSKADASALAAKADASALAGKADASALAAKLDRTHTMPSADPATPPALKIVQNNDVDDVSAELMQVFYQAVKTFWMNEGGNPRVEAYDADQVALKLFTRRTNGLTPTANILEMGNFNGMVFAIGPNGRPKLGPTLATNASHVVVLGPTDPVPTNLPTDTVFLRTA